VKKQKAKADANIHLRLRRLRDEDVQRLGRGPQAIANAASSLRHVGMSAHGTGVGPAPDADALEALEDTFCELRSQWVEDYDSDDCSWHFRCDELRHGEH
jgi:hypothetical protein